MKQWALNTLRRHRKARANRSAFGALIAAPVVGSVMLPAAARVGFVAVAGAVALTKAAEVESATTRVIYTPLMDAGTVLVLDHAERGTVVTAEAGFDVVIDIGLGVWAKIAEGE